LKYGCVRYVSDMISHALVSVAAATANLPCHSGTHAPIGQWPKRL